MPAISHGNRPRAPPMPLPGALVEIETVAVRSQLLGEGEATGAQLATHERQKVSEHIVISVKGFDKCGLVLVAIQA